MFGILLLAPKAGCEEKRPAQKIDTLKSMDELDNSQKLKRGYLICIRILEDKRTALQQYVAVTGEIQAPYIGLVKADGLTCRELAFKIKSEMAKIDKSSFGDYMRKAKLEESFFENATVLVTLDAEGDLTTLHRDPDLPLVFAFGAFAKQGKFDLAGFPDHKLSGLIKYAGGLTSKSIAPKIRVIRKTDQGNKTLVVDGKAFLEQRPEADLVLLDGDVIIVD